MRAYASRGVRRTWSILLNPRIISRYENSMPSIDTPCHRGTHRRKTCFCIKFPLQDYFRHNPDKVIMLRRNRHLEVDILTTSIVLLARTVGTHAQSWYARVIPPAAWVSLTKDGYRSWSLLWHFSPNGEVNVQVVSVLTTTWTILLYLPRSVEYNQICRYEIGRYGSGGYNLRKHRSGWLTSLLVATDASSRLSWDMRFTKLFDEGPLKKLWGWHTAHIASHTGHEHSIHHSGPKTQYA